MQTVRTTGKAVLLLVIVSVLFLPVAAYAQDDELGEEENAFLAAIHDAYGEVIITLNELDTVLARCPEGLPLGRFDYVEDVRAANAVFTIAKEMVCALVPPPSLADYRASLSKVCALAQRAEADFGKFASQIDTAVIRAETYNVHPFDQARDDAIASLNSLRNAVIDARAELDAQVYKLRVDRRKAAEAHNEPRDEEDNDGEDDDGGDESLPFMDQFFDECFIATAAYGTKTAAEIDILRDFRDEFLTDSAAGRAFIRFYYDNSPPVAACIAERPALRFLVREYLVDPCVFWVRFTSGLWRN